MLNTLDRWNIEYSLKWISAIQAQWNEIEDVIGRYYVIFTNNGVSTGCIDTDYLYLINRMYTVNSFGDLNTYIENLLCELQELQRSEHEKDHDI